jgi:Arc/MetJ family transcription regulator
MATNLNIDESLLEEAQRLGRKKTKRETVNEALSEYINRRKQREILGLFGKVDYDAAYDYKSQRRQR